MKPKTWFILPQAYSITLTSEQTESMTVQQKKAMKMLNSKDEMKKWLTGFLPKLKRESTRKAQCRLILSVERMLFNAHKYAASWQYVRFEKNEAEILDKDKTPLQKIKITEFQRMILEPDEMKGSDAEFCRSDIRAEKGKWDIKEELEKERISEGGEALVFSQKFEDLTTAVRIHIFDPFLFTEEFCSKMVIWKAHFERDFSKAFKEDKKDKKNMNQ
jgi:hypothetical protein